jgi:probable rRNA maturation factor
MIVEIANMTKTKIPEKKILQWIAFFEKKISKLKSQKTFTVAFVPKTRIQRLNKMYRKKDKPTDVLSFAGTYPQHFGDLVLCPQVIKKQAKEHGLTFELELAYMILHGVLHLLGYEHEQSAKKARIMFALQDKIFQLLSNHEFKY